MPTIIEKTVYKFEELNDTAKEKARSWWRDGSLDQDWYEAIYEDANTVAKILGIEIAEKHVPLMGGGTRAHPKIWFNGFSSQGDGACFEGRYSYHKGWRKELKAYAPKDKELLRIGLELSKAQRPSFYLCSSVITHSGHYYHSGCMQFDTGCLDVSCPPEWAERIEQALRDFADWIYKRLGDEHSYQMSDEYVDESIKCNEYDFEEDGSLA